MIKSAHYPVMAANVLRCIVSRNFRNPIRIADCTFGLGGHSLLILKKFPLAKILAYQIDPRIIQHFELNQKNNFLESEHKRLTLRNESYTNLSLEAQSSLDIIFVDLGFNSIHVDTQRGFTWLRDEPLDMRYSESGVSISEIINRLSLVELKDILSRFGQLKDSVNIARMIIAARPIRTTWQLRDAVMPCFQQQKTRKIGQVFQAFRICANNQMLNLKALCEAASKVLAPEGLFLAITFHSLERDVIHRYAKQNKCYSKVKTQTPEAAEVEVNPRSHCAKLLHFSKNQ